MRSMRMVVLVASLAGCDDALGLGGVTAPPNRPEDSEDLDAEAIDAPTPPSCPGTYASVLDSHFAIVTTTATWAEAAGACDGVVPGGYSHLAVLADDAQRQALASSATATYWIGLSDQRTVSVFRWNTGETGNIADSAAWSTGQPAGSGCVMMSGGSWQIVDCNQQLAYICECDAHANDLSQYQ